MVTAAEDIGLAYPNALFIVKSAVDIALQVGLPEAQLPLADAVILLATAPKSNSGGKAIWAAMADVAAGNYSDAAPEGQPLQRGEKTRPGPDLPLPPRIPERLGRAELYAG